MSKPSTRLPSQRTHTCRPAAYRCCFLPQPSRVESLAPCKVYTRLASTARQWRIGSSSAARSNRRTIRTAKQLFAPRRRYRKTGKQAGVRPGVWSSSAVRVRSSQWWCVLWTGWWFHPLYRDRCTVMDRPWKSPRVSGGGRVTVAGSGTGKASAKFRQESGWRSKSVVCRIRSQWACRGSWLGWRG